jgi:ferredoxin
MKIIVDLTRCQGYAQCAFAAPDVFAMRGDEALLYDPAPDDAQREKIARAAAACPVQAIYLDQEAARHRQPGPGPHVATSDHVATQALRRRSSAPSASSSSGRPWLGCGPVGHCAGRASPAR